MSQHTVIGEQALPNKRMHYFSGQFLEAEDFDTEQAYHIARRRLLNRESLGPGVHDGFQVTRKDDEHILITAGLAINAAGGELWLQKNTLLPLKNPKDGAYYVCIRLLEKDTDNVEYDLPVSSSDISRTWSGDKRTTEIVEFSLRQEEEPVDKEALYLRIASIKVAGAKLASVDNSACELAAGVALQADGYLGLFYNHKLNATIGAAPSPQRPGVTLNSLSQRLYLAGDEQLYLVNKQGVIISKDWQGNGNLKVEGALDVTGEITSHSKDFKLGSGIRKKNEATTVGPGRAFSADDCTLRINFQDDWDKTIIGGSRVEINGVLDVWEIHQRSRDIYLGEKRQIGNLFRPGRALVAGGELYLNYDNDWGKTVIGGEVEVRKNLAIPQGELKAATAHITGAAKIDGPLTVWQITQTGRDLVMGAKRKIRQEQDSRAGRAIVAWNEGDFHALNLNFQRDWDYTILGGTTIHEPGFRYESKSQLVSVMRDRLAEGSFALVVEPADLGTNLGIFWKVNGQLKRGYIKAEPVL